MLPANIKAGESICFKAGTSYNIQNIGTSPLEIIEISMGDMTETVVIQQESVEKHINTTVLPVHAETHSLTK